MSKTQRHRQEPDRRPCDKHITSPLVRLQTAVLLTSANNNARPAWPCSTLFVRRRCQRTLASLASRKDAPPIHPNPTQLVNAHVCSSRVARSHCRLTDPSSPVCELDALPALRACASARSAGARDGSWMYRMRCCMSHTRKHSYPSPWPGKTRGGLSHAAFGRTSHPR